MVGSHKILTVSYGTFSCTLEGFEDSFDTMKAIAEYFRDLAADDRYFGAEPPQPDAEMLARIAEREVARRVEARMDSSGIVLRMGQSLDVGQGAAAAPAAAAVAQMPTMPPVAQGGQVAATVPETKAPPMVQPSADSVAAKLQRIRAVVGKGAAAPVVADIDDAVETADAVEPEGEMAALAVVDIAEDAIPETAPETVPETAGLIAAIVAEANRAAPEPAPAVEMMSGFDAVIAAAPEVDLDDDVFADEAFADEAMPVAADAAAVVEIEADAPAPDAVVEVSDEGFALPDQTLTLIEGDVEDVLIAISEPDLPSETTPVEPALKAAAAPVVHDVAEALVADHPIRARVIRMRKADFDRAVAAGALVAEAEADANAEIGIGADLAADLAEADDRGDFDFDDLADLADLSDLADQSDIDDLGRLDAALPSLTPDAEAELLAELAAVERDPIGEAELDDAEVEFEDDLGAELAAIAAGDEDVTPDRGAQIAQDAEDDAISGVLRALQTDETFPDELFADDVPAAGVGRVDADDHEAEIAARAVADDFAETLADEVEAVEAEVAATDLDAALDAAAIAAAATVPADSSEPEVEPEAARPRFAAPEADEAALTRLLSQTDAQMSGPDAARRREAIAQLRAAVAATEAARALGEPTGAAGAGSEEEFREDLRHAVRPRRPVGGQNDLRSERPRPAPLKLVASQRIDLPSEVPAAHLAPAAVQPIRPRRVTVDQIAAARTSDVEERSGQDASAVAAASDSFADFAERMGAVSLADMLEAAAAYTAFVEGTGDFSRPQILRRVSQISPDASKEDGLRLFGTLLREGRIRRSDRAGRFEVAEDTRFNPDRRAV